MSKRIIIVENCEDCPDSCMRFLIPEDRVCSKMFTKQGERVCPDESTPDWCSLRPLPERKDDADMVGFTIGKPITKELADKLIAFGFNICLDAIMGEEK